MTIESQAQRFDAAEVSRLVSLNLRRIERATEATVIHRGLRLMCKVKSRDQHCPDRIVSY